MTQRAEAADDVRADTGSLRAATGRLSGAKAPQQTAKSAGAAPRSAPQLTAGDASPGSDARAFQLLEEALRDIAERGSTPAAAGVSARMRQLEPDFIVSEYGFRTFRQLLSAAEEQGLVSVLQPEGSSDRIVQLRSRDVPGPRFTGRTWLRRDLWQAVLDYQLGGTYVFSRQSKTTVPVDLAPSDPGTDTDAVLVPTITSDVMVGWMRAFAERQGDGTRQALATALDSADPIRDFDMEVRRTSNLERRWKRDLHTNVTRHVLAWAARHEIPLTDLQVDPEPPASPTEPPQVPQRRDEEVLRRRILRALESMPLSELLKIPIPVEYVLRQ